MNKKFPDTTFNHPYSPLTEEEEDLSCKMDYFTVVTIILKVILWCLLMTLFVILEFGAVFFILSVFYLMFTNFRKTPKTKDERSAYSVFNPDCEPIQGTLTAKQLEKEMMFGPLVH